MRMLLLPLGMVGCQWLFPLDPAGLGPDAGPPDGPAGDAPLTQLDPIQCFAPGQIVALPLLADTYLDGTDTPRGRDSSMLLGESNRLLLRFHTFPIRPHNLGLRLTLHEALQADECGGPCGECGEPTTTSHDLTIRITRPDWDEALATTTIRTQDPWTETPGPGVSDVSQLIGGLTLEVMGGSATKLFQAMFPIDPAWTRDEISIVLDAPAATPIRWATRENLCPGIVAPQLVGICLAGALCGNRVIDAGELCDDGNTDDGDGCAADCASM